MLIYATIKTYKLVTEVWALDTELVA
jgi:hypothetical protein